MDYERIWKIWDRLRLICGGVVFATATYLLLENAWGVRSGWTLIAMIFLGLQPVITSLVPVSRKAKVFRVDLLDLIALLILLILFVTQ